MGDHYSYIVPQKVAKTEAPAIANKFANYLINRNIILADKTDCVLSEKLGYPPSENYGEVFEYPDENIFHLRTNGFGITIGRGPYFSNELDEINCPNCATDIMELEWGDAITEWMNETGKD